MDQAAMDHTDIAVPTAKLRSIAFDILSRADAAKHGAAKKIKAVTEVTDPALGLPNTINQCFTCGTKDRRECEGHFGLIEFPLTILNPYFLPEVVQILNKICPACKSFKVKISESLFVRERRSDCKYCNPGRSKDLYPAIKFKISSKDVFSKASITAEVKTSSNRPSQEEIASDFWDCIPSAEKQEENSSSTNTYVLSHAQVYDILKDLDPNFLESLFKRKNSILLESFLLSPNCHRVTEFGHHIIFDTTTKHYKKLIDFKGTANELSSRVLERIRASKIHSDKSSAVDPAFNTSSFNDSAAPTSGLKYIKELILGKRTDHAFRMVIVGDPYIELGEIGMPSHIAEKLQVSEHVNKWNIDKLQRYATLMLIAGREIQIRRGSRLSKLTISDQICCGDVLHRPMLDGDTVLINRPPSIHQHSILSLTVRILPNESSLSINPLICSPLRGDFDGDCIHGYVPQSVDSRVELSELVAIDKQLLNGQSGRNLLALSHDSLTAAHLILEDGITLNKLRMQQLLMFCSFQLQIPAITKNEKNTCFWTGKQLFSQLMPPGFNYVFPSNGVYITKGEIVASSGGSAWLRDTDGNLFHELIKYCNDEVIAILQAAQEVLCEWLSMRGLSVSLSDLYLASDPCSRENMIQEVSCGLQEAEFLSEIEPMMVDVNQNFLAECIEENNKIEDFGVGRICMQQQKSAALSQASVSAFKRVFSDVQYLAYLYASKQNSFLAMLKAGSKGNLQKLVQHSMCLGLQHSVAPLSFRMPQRLSCAAWNDHKISLCKSHASLETYGSYIPFAVVENSFLTGLNPLECFVHSVTNRDGSFSGHADVSGTLTRKLMFFMRDLCTEYDGTVRNAYGNQIVQFSYQTKENQTSEIIDEFSGGRANVNDVTGGHTVGSLAACAISEAAYSALDQPTGTLESSPLLNLKKILDCGVKRCSGDKTASIFLSKKLGKLANGFEYGALEVKDHLQRLMFGEIVSNAMICYSQEICGPSHISPWICHFHTPKEIFKRRRLRMNSIIGALHATWNTVKVKVRVKSKSKLLLPDLKISVNTRCSQAVKENETDSKVCIMVSLLDKSRASSSHLDVLRDMVIPNLLESVIKGYPEFKKVAILWKDCPNSTSYKGASRGLYLRVYMSNNCESGKFWSILVDSCVQISDFIDWERSHPDDFHDLTSAYGIDTSVNYFLDSLSSAVCDIGKTVLPEHLVLTADCLSSTGEFIALNAKGLAQQRKATSVSSPFVQACFSNPGDCFVKAAKKGDVDNLAGTIDALSWGMVPPVGTGFRFDIMYPVKEYEPEKPVDVYDFLAKHRVPTIKKLPKKQYELCGKSLAQQLFTYRLKWNHLDINTLLRGFVSLKNIQNLAQTLKTLLHKYEINCKLSDVDKSVVLFALLFHPRGIEKIGTGALEIKVGYHSEYQNSRCFLLVRDDGTTEDFSYHKCVHNALQLIAPHRAKIYETKWLHSSKTEEVVANEPPLQI